ncbi:MAG: IclR family transcriptional regulator [Spirochaetales bacterium]
MTVQSIERIFDILELLSRERSGISLTEIGKRLDLHKSTVFRLMSVLRRRGYIEKGEDNLYRIGVRFIELSSSYLNNIELKTEAEPVLRALSNATGQTVYLAVLQDNEAVYLDKVEQHNSLRKYSIIGQRRPLYCTSLGKAMIMHRSDEEIEELFEGVVFERFTPNTIQDLPTLLEELRVSRERGWTFDNEEHELGVQCLGAPIRDYRGVVIGAISVAMICRQQKMNTEEIAPLVVQAAREISLRLGWIGCGPTLSRETVLSV